MCRLIRIKKNIGIISYQVTKVRIDSKQKHLGWLVDKKINQLFLIIKSIISRGQRNSGIDTQRATCVFPIACRLNSDKIEFKYESSPATGYLLKSWDRSVIVISKCKNSRHKLRLRNDYTSAETRISRSFQSKLQLGAYPRGLFQSSRGTYERKLLKYRK